MFDKKVTKIASQLMKGGLPEKLDTLLTMIDEELSFSKTLSGALKAFKDSGLNFIIGDWRPQDLKIMSLMYANGLEQDEAEAVFFKEPPLSDAYNSYISVKKINLWYICELKRVLGQRENYS